MTTGVRSAWTIRGRATSSCWQQPDSWFAYPYWLDDGLAPDFARTVDIHRKPGYDPCELFFDPRLVVAQGPRDPAARFRRSWGSARLFDVIPLDPALVRGSHGVPAARAEDRPILIGDGPAPSRGRIHSDDRSSRFAATGLFQPTDVCSPAPRSNSKRADLAGSPS